MVGQTTARTKADNQRFEIMQELGCLPCLLDGWTEVGMTVQHVTEAGRRLGHQFTYPSCPWHHQGIKPSDFGGSIEHATRCFGASFARDKRAFADRYGSERELVQVTDALVRIVARDRANGKCINHHQLKNLVLSIYNEIKFGRGVNERWRKIDQENRRRR